MKDNMQECKAGNKNSRRLPMVLYLAAWLFCVAWFWLGMDGGGWIMAYTILVYWVILPVASLVSGFLLARREVLGRWVWVPMLAMGALNIAVPYVTFVLGTVLKVVNIAQPGPEMLLFLLPGAVGLGLGTLFRRMHWGPKAAAACLLILLGLCYLGIKSLGGSILRFLPIVDIPAIVILGAAVWYFLRRRSTHAA